MKEMLRDISESNTYIFFEQHAIFVLVVVILVLSFLLLKKLIKQLVKRYRGFLSLVFPTSFVGILPLYTLCERVWGWEVAVKTAISLGVPVLGVKILEGRVDKEIEDEWNKKLEKERKRADRYKDELKQKRLDTVEQYLQKIYNSLQFGRSERISIYYYTENDAGKGGFECIARYSTHKEHKKKALRKNYPCKSGIIGKVWLDCDHDGYVFDGNIPCPERDGEAEYKQYLKNNYRINKKTSADFRMKAISILGCLIEDTKENSLAVIIFESKKRDKIDEDRVKDKYKSEFKQNLQSTLSELVDDKEFKRA